MTQAANPGDPSPYSAQGSDEYLWSRPQDPSRHDPSRRHDPPAYSGPPKSVPPPAGWRPPTLIQVPEARPLPPQDLDALDGQEREAAVTTYGVGLIAGAIALLILVVLCGRLIF